MSVNNTPPVIQHDGNGATKSFNYPFKVLNGADLVAQVGDATLVYGLDYAVTGVGDDVGGQVVFVVAPVVGAANVTLSRQIKFDRSTDYQYQGPLPAKVVNEDLDRVVMMLQQAGQDIKRSFKLPFATFTNQELTQTSVQRANKAIVFDADGNLNIGTDNYNDQAVDAAASAAAALASQNAVAADAAEVEEDRLAAEASAQSAAVSAASIDPTKLIHTTGNETKAGTLKFDDSPLVPTATIANQATNKGQMDAAIATGIALRGYISGLILSTAGASSTFSVSAGMATNSTSTVLMALATAMNKTTAAWAVGSGNGALDAGTIANNTAYSVFEIRNSTSGAVDILISLSATAPTMPAGFTQFRRIGSMLTNGSGQWRKFLQRGDEFWSDAPVLDVDIANEPITAVLRTLSVPTGVKVQVLMNVGQDTTGVASIYYLSDPDLPDLAPSISVAPLASGSHTFTGRVIIPQRCWTNTSGQIRTRHSAGSASNSFRIVTLGWVDTRGRFD